MVVTQHYVVQGVHETQSSLVFASAHSPGNIPRIFFDAVLLLSARNARNNQSLLSGIEAVKPKGKPVKTAEGKKSESSTINACQGSDLFPHCFTRVYLLRFSRAPTHQYGSTPFVTRRDEEHNAVIPIRRRSILCFSVLSTKKERKMLAHSSRAKKLSFCVANLRIWFFDQGQKLVFPNGCNTYSPLFTIQSNFWSSNDTGSLAFSCDLLDGAGRRTGKVGTLVDSCQHHLCMHLRLIRAAFPSNSSNKTQTTSPNAGRLMIKV